MYKNIVANYFGKFSGFVSIYIFIPIYIKLLGVENYALINFYTVLLSIMLIADIGLSATLNREIARTDDKNYQRDLLRTIEVIYFGIALAIFLLVFCFAHLIADKWLHAENISVRNVTVYIRLMGACIAFQLLTIMYNSGLLGLQKQVKANSIQVLANFSRQGLVIIPLFFIKSLDVFFVWQLCINFIFFLISRNALWKYIDKTSRPKFKKSIFKSIGAFTLGMMLMALMASTNTQIDKIFVSKLLSLKVYGYYSLASIFSQSSVIFLMPIVTAILPKMTKMAETNDIGSQKVLFHRYSFLIATISCSITMVLFLYSNELIMLWTNNMAIVTSIQYVTKFLLIGGMFLGLQYMPYYLAIAHGHTKTNVRLGLIMMCLFIPSMYFCISKYGLIGASFPWIVLNVIGTIYLGYFIIKKFLKGNFISWLVTDTFIPISISLVLGVVFYFLTINIKNNFNILITAGLVGLVNLLVNSIVYLKIYLKISLHQFIKTYVKK